MSAFIDLTGQRFGRLVALEATEKRAGSSVVWQCICDCGKKCFVPSQSLRSGGTRSCGCLQITHGMTQTREYKTWLGMIHRCMNLRHIAYKNYGGRGVKVCERWHTFENFLEDMGPRPEGMTLDRWPDNDSNYELKNCRWATNYEQRINSRPASCGPNKQRWFFAYYENTGEWFEDNSQRGFAKEHKLTSQGISDCLLGKQKTHKGWTFDSLT